MKINTIPVVVVDSSNDCVKTKEDVNPLSPKEDLSLPRPLRVCFPILLDGDLVLSSEHLGPAYLVSVLRNAKAECKIFEVPIEANVTDVILDIKEWKPDIIGISLTTISVALAKKFGSLLREHFGKETYILAGGPLATYKADKLLTLEGWDFVDGLIRGEGEIPMLRFAEAFHCKKDLSIVPNLVYRCSGEIKQNPMGAGVEDLDFLPYPARDQFEFHNKKLAYLRISTSRGCTSHCTFCNAPHTKNRVGPAVKGWRGSSPLRVVDEIEHLYHKYRFNTFDFVDSTFEDPGGKLKAKTRIATIAEEILRRNLRIYYNVCMQAYNWTDADVPLIELLWKSGLEKVLVGIESGSEIGLRRWQKRSTVEDNVRVIRLLRDAKIYVAFGFISYHPWSTFEEIQDNNLFLFHQFGHNLRRYTTRLEIYPGAEVVDQLRDEGLLLKDYDERLNPFAYSYVDPRIEKLATALNGLYGKKYAEDCVIEKEPAVFQFETYDIILHTFLTRLSRYYSSNSAANEILETLNSDIELIKKDISAYNYSNISHYIELAENETLTNEKVWNNAEDLDNYYTQKINQMRSLQLRASMHLHRAGCKVNIIQEAVS